MSNLVLFASADSGSRTNFSRTMEMGVPPPVLSQHLTPTEMDLLRLHHGDGNVPIWGVWPARDGRQVGKWERVQPGDLAVFSRPGGLRAHARVIHAFRSPSLASALWDDKQTAAGPVPYELMFAFDGLTDISLDYTALNPTLPGWSAGASIREFNVIETERSAAAQALVLGLPVTAVDRPHALRIAVEASSVDSYVAQRSSEGPAVSVRQEAALVRDFVAWSATQGHDCSRHRIPLPEGGSLYTDIYINQLDEVVEAKSDASRHSVRLALGQVLDYSRLLPEAKRRSILLPGRPRTDLIELLALYDVGTIWWTGTGFQRADP